MWLSELFLLLWPCTNTFQLQGSWTVLKSCEEMRCIAKYCPNLALVSSHKQMVVYELHDLHPAWRDMQLSAGLPVKSKYAMCCGFCKHVAGTRTIMEFIWWRCSTVYFEGNSNKGADQVIPVWWLFQQFYYVIVVIVTSAAAAADDDVATWESDHQLWVGKDLEGGSSVSVNRFSLCTLFQVMQSQT